MQVLHDEWTRLGFDPKYMGKVTKDGVIKRAIAETVQDLRNSNYTYKKIGDENSDVVVYKIFKMECESINGKLDGEMKPYAHITYRKQSEMIEIDNPEIESMLNTHYKFFTLNYMNLDYTRYTKTMIERESVCLSLRPQGGVYIVPAKDKDMVYKLKELFNRVDPDGDFHITEIPDLDGAKESIASAYQPVMQDMCAKLEEKITELESKGKQLSSKKRQELFDEVCFLGKDIELMMDVSEYDLSSGKDMLIKVNEHIMNFTPIAKDETENKED